MSNNKKTIVKKYRGKLEVATLLFEQDANKMEKENYFPVTQNYVPGSWGCMSFLVALLLCVIVVGVLVFVYMLIVKPAGTLVVTYELKESLEKSNE